MSPDQWALLGLLLIGAAVFYGIAAKFGEKPGNAKMDYRKYRNKRR